MITSTSNAKVKRLVNLKKKRKARDAEGVFLVEGIRMFREVPEEKLLEIYVTESFLEKQRTLIHEKAKAAKAFVEVLSDTVFAHASDTMTPQGILCVVRQMSYERNEVEGIDVTAGASGCKEADERTPLLLVLDNLQDPGNLGTIVRTAEGAGVTGIVMSKDCVDIYNPKTIRSTMGSIYRVPFLYEENLVKALEELKEKKINLYAAHLEGACSYETCDYCVGSAFLIGNEGNGLRDEVASCADRRIKIPMCGQVESLNAAIAATVLMFEAARQRRR